MVGKKLIEILRKTFLFSILAACSGVHIANPGSKKPPKSESSIQFRWAYNSPEEIRTIQIHLKSIYTINSEGKQIELYSFTPETSQISLEQEKKIAVIGDDFPLEAGNYKEIGIRFKIENGISLSLIDGKQVSEEELPSSFRDIKLKKDFSVTESASVVLVEFDLNKSITLKSSQLENGDAVTSISQLSPKFNTEKDQFSFVIPDEYFKYSPKVSFENKVANGTNSGKKNNEGTIITPVIEIPNTPPTDPVNKVTEDDPNPEEPDQPINEISPTPRSDGLTIYFDKKIAGVVCLY